MFNRVVLVGRMAVEPELSYTPSGVAVAKFRLAVNRPFKNAEGKNEADFIDCVAWRQAAEFTANYLGKGRLALVEGRLQVRSYDTQDGQRRKVSEVVCDNVRGLDRPKDGEESAPQVTPGSFGDESDPFQDE